MALQDSEPVRFSLAGRLAGIIVLSLALFAGLTWIGRWLLIPDWRAFLLAAVVVLPLAIWTVARFVRPLTETLESLSDGIRSFEDRDFSLRIATRREDELGQLIHIYNRVGDILQEERGDLRQRELLLQTALDQSPTAIVLVNPLDRIIYGNPEARRLLLGGERLVGRKFGEILVACPAEMRRILDGGGSGIFTATGGDEPETYHLSQRSFMLNRQRHTLYLLRRMTAELARNEAEIWKRAIRTISHELRNSLAPISSLAYSGLQIAREAKQAERLEPVYASIRERVDHLTTFLEGYARFARLPEPQKQPVEWADWLAGIRELYAFEIVGKLPAKPGCFDPAQMQQVLINLLKNAAEASEGAPECAIRIDHLSDAGVRIQVLDRGRGVSDEVMRSALLPFYSTKHAGSGIGLPLCREIVEAHGGSLRIQNREGGGTAVTFWLPPRNPHPRNPHPG